MLLIPWRLLQVWISMVGRSGGASDGCGRRMRRRGRTACNTRGEEGGGGEERAEFDRKVIELRRAHQAEVNEVYFSSFEDVIRRWGVGGVIRVILVGRGRVERHCRRSSQRGGGGRRRRRHLSEDTLCGYVVCSGRTVYCVCAFCVEIRLESRCDLN